MISVVVTVYNRELVIDRCLESVIDFHKKTSLISEIVIVDDCSTDFSVEKIHDFIIVNGLVDCKVILNTANQGVSFSKDRGARECESEWIIFLDSDDILSFHADFKISDYLGCDLVFFRSSDESGLIVGNLLCSTPIDIETYVRSGTFGESLPMIRKDIYLAYPYWSALRGCEGICYAQILLSHGNVFCSKVPLRIYYDSPDSLSRHLSARRHYISVYHWYLLMISFNRVSFKAKIKLFLKACFSAVVYVKNH